MAGSWNRTGRVSNIDYKAGTYEITYFDRGQSVTRKINAMSNGEYMMPEVGQIVSVSHNSNGTAAAISAGTPWNKTNVPAEGYKGLFRKEYANTKGQAYERYDANTGVYTQFIDKRTGRICNGEIYDEAKGSATFAANKQIQMMSREASASMQAKTSAGIVAGDDISLEAGKNIILDAAGGMSTAVGGEAEELYKDKVKHKLEKGLESTVEGGEVKLTLNGVVITISEEGDVTITAPKKIDVIAKEIDLTADSGVIKGLVLA